MNTSVNWLSALLDREIDPSDAAKRLAMLGAPVDEIETLFDGLGEIVIGLVEHAEQHPNADRLTLCQVNDGNQVIEVVCGAPNVAAGKKYPYAAVGTVLPGGLKLTARKIRGIASNGMLCSARELELGEDHDGILELDTDAEPGTPLLEVLPLLDTRLVLDVTPNRPDLLCHKGIARDLGAVYGAPVKLETIPNAPTDSLLPRQTSGTGSVDGVEVTIEDVEGCPRYMAAVIRGVKIGPSPDWLQARLRGVGARPINNVVDATNFILFELGQPLHAFDLAKVRGNKIIVRSAKSGEQMLTLDGEKRELGTGMTLICDAEGPTAIAGLMGGAESEVSAGTTDILLECAYFDPKRIRATRKALRMTTEASYRFERGIDLEGMPDTLVRAVLLIRAVAGGTEADAPTDVYPAPEKSRIVFLRPERVEHLLGTEIAREEIEKHLVSVGFVSVPKGDRLAVQIPGWRPDVTREVDLIEEVARLIGYDQLPSELLPFRPSTVPDHPVEKLKAQVRSVLTAMGLNEARTLPLVNREHETGGVALLNPMSQDETHLRESLLPGLVRSAQHNWSVRERNIRLFEIGIVFNDSGEGVRPTEVLRLAGVLTGSRTPAHWTSQDGASDYDLWDLKHVFAKMVELCGMVGTIFPAGEELVLQTPYEEIVGRAAAVDVEQPAWAAPLLGFELDMVVSEAEKGSYRPLPTTPPVERDLALVLPPGVTVDQVEEVIRGASGPLLESAGVFDEYLSEDIAGRSVAWRLVFRSRERTLKDREADKTVSRILNQLKDRLSVERRQT
ncbi:phenylalanine--tRNA ligase subunit beta [Gemmatimonadota bacterium]